VVTVTSRTDTARPDTAAGQETPAEQDGGRARRPVRAVLYAGIAIGTALAVLAEWDGAHPRIGHMPAWLGVIAGAVVLWLAVTGLAVWAAALLRRYHRAVARAAWRHGRRAAVAGARGTRRHGGRLAGLATAAAAERWQRRGPAVRDPLIINRADSGDSGGSQDSPAPQQPGPVALTDSQMSECIAAAVRRAWYGRDPQKPPQVTRTAPGVYEVRLPPGVINPKIMAADPHRAAEQELAAALGIPVRLSGHRRTPDGAAVTVRVLSGAEPSPPAASRPASKAPAPAGAAATTPAEGAATMTATTRTLPAHWTGVASAASDFEPHSDAELLEWMSGEVAGMLGYGEALADVHEHCVSEVRLDPAAMATLHDVADAAADAAEAMARAIEKFKQVYEGPREFVADGGVLPKSGDFITGDDDA
jgi:hypothetical protein